ncbi:MAG: hypothetical protein LIP01_04700 [Tannerellaceae bacterium]|nr:hypothetical protein [Tannerellaceae bacterium]
MNWVITYLMSILGFGSNSCENATEEYGVPHATFSVKNNVNKFTEEEQEDYQIESSY